MPQTDEELKTEITSLIVETSGGVVTGAQVVDESANLLEKGFSSLSFLQLIDALETRYGIYIDLEGDTRFLGRVSSIVTFLREQHVD
ncbi:phosphopantetheine-binding protein [Actinophytocola oryzae]|uniref:Phosphopantetheine binding protein n=1 Tax=Actinophytocola oryzae TaxID=502181 RepID=A0A4R7VKI5_9PSEU|nr:phosphopantetheine-binding protein [Actinophytocola oryzae]TDV49757.1 phosphopantetheine binding protein [Actinophytocola oryzae]